MSSIGQRIKQLRKARNITQKEFSDRICVTQSYISRLESDAEHPTDMLIKLIALEFNASLQWLINGKGSMFLEDAEYDYWDRQSASSLRDGVAKHLSDFAVFLNQHSNTVIDQSIGGIMVEFENILSLFDDDMNFGSLIFEQLTNIIVAFRESIEKIEKSEKQDENYTHIVYTSLWRTLDQVNDSVRDISTAYQERTLKDA